MFDVNWITVCKASGPIFTLLAVHFPDLEIRLAQLCGISVAFAERTAHRWERRNKTGSARRFVCTLLENGSITFSKNRRLRTRSGSYSMSLYCRSSDFCSAPSRQQYDDLKGRLSICWAVVMHLALMLTAQSPHPPINIPLRPVECKSAAAKYLVHLEMPTESDRPSPTT